MDGSKILVVVCLLIFAGLLWWQEQAGLDEWSGVPKVVDGDSLILNNERVRLRGIDAPEGRQYCEKQGKKWACGRAATSALRRLIGGQNVACTGSEFDKHDRLLGVCTVGDVEINRFMVREGWAVSFGGGYKSIERDARSAKKGLWQGTFEMPGDWRARNFR